MPPARGTDRVPALVLVGGVLVTLAFVALLARTATQRDEQEFEAAANQAQAAILAKVETSVALLRGAAGLFASAHETVTVPAFRAYVERLALRERYPGLLGIGFARRVQPGGEREIAQELRRQGHEEFRVWPAPAYGERTSIVFLEPLDERNLAALGYDMATDGIRRDAMERARDSGQPTASGAVVLVQEIHEEKQPGFLIYLPVYRDGATPTTVEERRERLIGFAYSPIRAVDFLSSAFAYEATPEVGIAVRQGASPGSGMLLYARPVRGVSPRYHMSSTIHVAGQPWTFDFSSRKAIHDSLALPLVVLLAGISLAIVVATLVRRERLARAHEQRALDAERAARAEAERANRIKDEFFMTLSHELRTPLHAIVGWTTVLSLPNVGEEQRRMGIDVIERNAQAQSRLIEDLLDMSRIASGKLHLDLRPVEVAEVVADTCKSQSPSAEAKAIALECHLPGVPTLVQGDPTRLQQIVSNLISNAIKFTPREGRIDVRLERADPVTRITVSDTGEGIDPKLLRLLFNRFTQADSSTSRRHGGLGLGLAIVRQLAELHHGTVRAQSEGPGRGSSFVVELPLLESGGDAAEAQAARRGPHEALRGVKVLAVDDDADAREMMRAVLAGRGAEVRAVDSAKAALDAMREAPFDVLLSDIGMPDMDGYALMRQVRDLPPERGGRVRAAAITAYARDSDRDSALGAGFDMHLAKPLRGEAFVEAVAALAGLRSEAPEETQRGRRAAWGRPEAGL